MFSNFRYRLCALFRRNSMEAELDEELRAHVEQQAEKYVQAGMSPEEAARRARLEFGGIEQVKEECRDSWGIRLTNELTQDIRYGLRQLRRNPGFTIVAVLTLALGIGTNTAIFSVINGVLLRPLPYPQTDRIARLLLERKDGGTNPDLTVPEFEFYRDHSDVFRAIAAFQGGPDLSLKRGDSYEWLSSLQVTDGFFQTIGINPALGRGFDREETRPGAQNVAILSDAVWRNVFGADPGVIGRQVVLNGQGYIVVGVMPRRFTFVEQPAQIFTAYKLGRSVGDLGMNTSVLARLKPGVSLAEAQSDMAVVFEQFSTQGIDQKGFWRGIRLTRYQDWLVGPFRPSLLLLFGAVGFLLLIACANVASLCLARATVRRRETAIRLALGAGRSRLLRQLLTESLLLAAAGAAAGLLSAFWSLHSLVAAIPWDLPAGNQIKLDGRVLMFTIVLSIVTSLVFGLASFWQASRVELNPSLKEGDRQLSRGIRSRLRRALVAGEVALSVMLLIGSGLLIKSLYHLHEEKLGFDPHRVITFKTPLDPSLHWTEAQWASFEQQVLQRIKMLPGVSSAAMVTVPPLVGQNNFPTQREGHPEDSIGGMEIRAISPNYFRTMRIPLLSGRGVMKTDTASSSPVVVINETLARTWWPGKTPIGDRIMVGEYRGRTFGKPGPARQVVGVVGDVKGRALDEPPPPMIYVPASQLPGSTWWVVRTRSNADMGLVLRKAVAAVNPEQRVLYLRPLADFVSRSVAQPSFNALLTGLFAALAMALTAVGIYGVLNFYVSQRTHEIGIHMALGAQKSDVLKMVVGEGIGLSFVGLVIGIIAALAMTRFLSSLLYGVKPTDPFTFIEVSLILVAVALVACYIPARRAANVDPMVALRYE